MYLNEDIKYTLTTVSQTISQTVPGIKNRRLKKIYVNPATSSTTYNLTLTDRNSEVIYEEGDITGKHIDITIDEWLYGNLTLTISNASKDEAFAVILTLIEEAY